jgi:uncharacterized membrane-anchored protein
MPFEMQLLLGHIAGLSSCLVYTFFFRFKADMTGDRFRYCWKCPTMLDILLFSLSVCLFFQAVLIALLHVLIEIC